MAVKYWRNQWPSAMKAFLTYISGTRHISAACACGGSVMRRRAHRRLAWRRNVSWRHVCGALQLIFNGVMAISSAGGVCVSLARRSRNAISHRVPHLSTYQREIAAASTKCHGSENAAAAKISSMAARQIEEIIINVSKASAKYRNGGMA